jgi:hypothetical protein
MVDFGAQDWYHGLFRWTIKPIFIESFCNWTSPRFIVRAHLPSGLFADLFDSLQIAVLCHLDQFSSDARTCEDQ